MCSSDLGEESGCDGSAITAEKFYSALRGYGKKVDNTSEMILLGFDAATPGRLSMVEEMTLDSARYLENIKKWHESCSWIHEKWKEKDKKRIRFLGMVGVKDIADILFGIENKGSLMIVDANGKKLYAEVAKRLIPCIWNGNKIPCDYVDRAILKASMPLTYKDWKNWAALLVDLAFAAIPFVTGGGGQVVKLANVADDISDFSKVTVIGESMSRVQTISQFVNATDNLYDGFKSYKKLSSLGKGGKVLAEIGGKSSNIAWLYGKLRSGYKVIDIGIDTVRTTRSSSYIVERITIAIWKSRNIWKWIYHLDF